MMLSTGSRIGIAGAAVVGVAFGMARYVYGLTLPSVRADLGLSELVTGLVTSATFAGYLAGLVFAGPLAARRGSRAPTTVGGVCGALGAVIVTVAQSPWSLALGAILAGSAGGWVWALYSDIVTRSVPLREQPRALATITTGTGGGLIVLAALAGAALLDSWRLVWAGVAIAAVVNVRLIPRTVPSARPRGDRGAASLARALQATAFTGCLVVGAISSVIAPAVAGAVIPGIGLGPLLVWSAGVSLLGAVALTLPSRSGRAHSV